MRWFDLFAMKARHVVRPARRRGPTRRGTRFHLDRQIAENIAAGHEPRRGPLCRAARPSAIPPCCASRPASKWSWHGAEQFLRDVRYGVRTLRRTPGFAIIAVLVMALGIGANVALFTVVRGVLLKPLPFKDPDRLMMLYERQPDGIPLQHGRRRRLCGVEETQPQLQQPGPGPGQPVRPLGLRRADARKLTGAQVSWNLFTTLGVQPALGRDFTAGDDTPSANGTVILSWSLWKRRFGANPGILNQTIYIDAKPYTVIGVMPEWFAFPEPEHPDAGRPFITKSPRRSWP